VISVNEWCADYKLRVVRPLPLMVLAMFFKMQHGAATQLKNSHTSAGLSYYKAEVAKLCCLSL